MGNQQVQNKEQEEEICIDQRGIHISYEEQQQLRKLNGKKNVQINKFCSEDTTLHENGGFQMRKKEKKNIKSQGNKQNQSSNIASCLGCMTHDQKDLHFDYQSKPKGKLTNNSIAYLAPSEINFFKSSATRNVSAIRFFLKKDEERTSPLHVASRHGSVQVVEELLNCGADCDITDIAGWTPLHVAAFFQRDTVCELLLKKGTDKQQSIQQRIKKLKKYSKNMQLILRMIIITATILSIFIIIQDLLNTLIKRVQDGEDQYYCIQEQDDEYFFNPNQKIKQDYERNLPPPPTINAIKNESGQSISSNQYLQDSRVLTQYEMIQQQNNEETQSVIQVINQLPNRQDVKLISNNTQNKQNKFDDPYNQQKDVIDDMQNNFTFKNLMDHSMENYKEEEIEEQKYDQFIIKDSVYMNSPKFTNNKGNHKTTSAAHSSKHKAVPHAQSQQLQFANEMGNYPNLNNQNKQLADGFSLINQKQIESPKISHLVKIHEDLIISPNPSNMNEFNSKADIVSNKMYVQKSNEIDFNDIEKYKLQSPLQRPNSQSQTSLLISQYQQSRKGSNYNTVAISNENEILEPNMLSPRKHKYYLYFKSLKNRLTQDKPSVGHDIDMNQYNLQINQNLGLVNFNTPNKQFQGFTYSNFSEHGTIFQEAGHDMKDIESLSKINSTNRIGNLDESSPKDKNLIDFSEGLNHFSQIGAQYQNQNFDEEIDESNIVVDDIDTKDIMKIQDSVKLKKIPGYNENGYVQKKQQIKEYLQNNQSIPFKLKNIYNTPCDPKKDLDFKMISNNIQNEHNNSNNVSFNAQKQQKTTQKGNQETIVYSNIQQGLQINEGKSQDNPVNIQNTQYKQINNPQQYFSQTSQNNLNADLNQIQIQNSPLLKRHSNQGQFSNKKKIPLSPTPSTNSIFFVNRQVLTIHQLIIDEDMLDSTVYQRGDNNPSSNGFNFQNGQTEAHNTNRRKKQPSIVQQISSPKHAGQMQNMGKTEIQHNRKPSMISNRQKYGFEFTQNILEIGISLFNSAPLNGLSFLMLFDYIKPESEDIIKFLMQNPSPPISPAQSNNFDSYYLLKKSKQAITEILTDLSIQENSEMLYNYSTFFNFSNSSFCNALKCFVQELQLENDPEQIDVLLSCFAKKFYIQNQQQSTLFESADSVHMLAFATFMLDIDIHFHKEPNLQKLIQEFQMNIQGINDGKNFSQDFVNNIIENLLDKKITHIVSSKLIEKQKQHYVAVFNLLLHEKAQIFVSVFKHSQKQTHQKIYAQGNASQQNEQELVLFILDNLAIVTNKNHISQPLSHISVFSMLSLIISFKNQVLVLKPAQIFNKNSIQIAKLDAQTQGFIIKQKQQIKFRVKGEEEGKLLDQKLRQLFSSSNQTAQLNKKN